MLILSFSQYNSVEEAAASRQALHGIKWPTTSPKILAVDFADNDEVSTCSRITLVFVLGRVCLTKNYSQKRSLRGFVSARTQDVGHNVRLQLIFLFQLIFGFPLF